MPSCLLKSIFVGATFLALTATGQIVNWDINYQSITSDFQESVINEITMDYNIGTGRTYKVDLFDNGCVSTVTGMTITHSETRTAGVSANHDGLKIMLDLDKSKITSSNIWEDNSFLRFCVRVQLLSAGSVINEE